MPTTVEHDTRVDLLTPELQPKLLHAGDEYVGQPYLLVTDQAVALIGTPNSGGVADAPFGIGLHGRLSITEAPDRVSFAGGYWRINPMVLSCIGSSAALPVPWLIPSTPELIKAAKDMKALVQKVESL